MPGRFGNTGDEATELTTKASGPRRDIRTRSELRADEAHDLGRFRELAVIKAVATLELGEVNDGHLQAFKRRTIRLLLGVDRPEPRGAAPEFARERESLVVLRYK